MLIYTRLIAGSFLFCGASGCAIYPSPENVTGFDPFEIERHVRCEMKQAIQDKFLALVRASGTSAMSELADSLSKDRTKIRHLLKYKYDPDVEFYLKKYYGAAVAYDFTFDITEDNSAEVGADLLPGLSGGTLKLGIKSAGDVSRQGVSRFQATDTFGLLMSDDIICDARMDDKNYAYPITGTIGVAKPLRQFIDLNEFGHLTNIATGSKPSDRVPTYSSTFNFQTTISASASPQVTLSPVMRGFGDASLAVGSKRVDIHKLILGFSLPVSSKKPEISFNIIDAGSPSLGFGKSPTENQALKVVDSSRIRQFFDTFTNTNFQ